MTQRMVLIVQSSLKNLKRMLVSNTLSLMERFGLKKKLNRVTESTLVVILTLSTFMFLLMMVTVMTLALGSGG